MNRPTIEAAIAELNAQQFNEPGEARAVAIEAALVKLNEVAPADINHITDSIRQFTHQGDTCDIVIYIQPGVFSVEVDWK